MLSYRSFFYFTLFLFFQNLAFGREFAIASKMTYFRAQPNFLGKAIGIAKYGEKVIILKKAGDWAQVKTSGKSGWVHNSALQDSYYILKEIGKSKEATKSTYSSEIVAAGKGFSPEYESMVKEKNPTLDYTAVDKLERWKISAEVLSKFGKKGELNSETFK